MIWTASPNQIADKCQTNLEMPCFQRRLTSKNPNLDSSEIKPNPTSGHHRRGRARPARSPLET